MVSSRARTVKAYLKELPADRRAVVSKLRSVIRRHLPAGYQETMNWGMIAYQVPLERYPETYNGEPLLYAAVAAQKRHYSLYLTSVYQQNALEKRLRAAFDRAGKKLDMGKSCIRFKTLEDLPMEALGEIVGSVSVEEFLKNYEKARLRPYA